MRRLILGGVLFACLGSIASAGNTLNNNDSKTLNERGHEDIFNPTVAAAAFKVGLANVASSSSNTRPATHKRANAFGKHGVDGGGHKKNKKRTPQVLGDLLGDDGDVLDQDGAMAVVNVHLEGGTLTSGSVSTVRVVPTAYITTSEGERSECSYTSCSVYTLYTSIPCLHIPGLARACMHARTLWPAVLFALHSSHSARASLTFNATRCSSLLSFRHDTILTYSIFAMQLL